MARYVDEFVIPVPRRKWTAIADWRAKRMKRMIWGDLKPVVRL